MESRNMAELQVSSSCSSNSSDTEESSLCYPVKTEPEVTTPGSKGDASPATDRDAGGVASAEQTGSNAATALGLAEGLDKLLQKQRRDLLFELRKLQHGQRPVTNTNSRETLEGFFSDALGLTQEVQPINRPESILSEVQGLSELRPVTSVLRSQGFRRNLEDVIRGTLVRQDRELQQAMRLRTGGFNIAPSRAPPASSRQDPHQQTLESLSQLSYSSSSGSHPSAGLADMAVGGAVFSPPPAPPIPTQAELPMHFQSQSFPPPPPPEELLAQQSQQLQPPYQQQQQWRPQQQPWQQQQQSWPQQAQQPWQPQVQQPWQPVQQQPWQQQQQPWQQQQQPWQPPVLPQQPWLMQNSQPQQQGTDGVNMVSLLQQAHREESVAEISNLVQRQLVSSTLNSEFRGTLESALMNRLAQTESDGLGVQNFIHSLEQSHPHRRNDFRHLGINAQPINRQQSAQGSGPASWAGPDLEALRSQMAEMQTMMKLTFELQMDMQRSIRQEVAAALNGQQWSGSSGQTSTAPIPPSQPASEGHCVICLEKSVDAVLYQCGHMCCCLSCGLRLKGMGAHCPMCRAPIRDVIRAYRCHRD